MPQTALPTAKWRALVERIAPQRGFYTPVPGSELLAHWVRLIPSSGRAHSLAIGWRIHKPTRRGLGKGHPLALDPAAEYAKSKGLAEDLKVIEAAGAANVSTSLRFMTAVSPDTADIVLRALSSAKFVYSEEEGGRIAFEPLPALPWILAEEEGDGLTVSAGWKLADGKDWAPANPRVVEGPAPWVEEGGVFRPVFGAGDGAALALLMEEGAWVPSYEIPAFLGSAVPALISVGAHVKVSAGIRAGEGGEGDGPRPRLYLADVEKALAAALRFAYGNFEVAAENPDPVVLLDVGGEKIRIVRDMDAELGAVRLLRSLGFSPVDPSTFEIDGDRALDFLHRGIATLPEEWEVFGRDKLKKSRVRQQSLTLGVRVGAGEDWLDLFAEASVGSDPVEIERVLKALRRGSRYVKLGDGSHAVLPEVWAARLGELVEELGLGSGSARLPRYMAPVAGELAVDADRWEVVDRAGWKRLNARLAGEGGERKVRVPKSLACELRPYQLRGYRWLKSMEAEGFGAVLADDMGLGKTVQALALLASEKEEGKGPSLVVAPTSVVHNWERETERHAPGLKALRYHGFERGKLRKKLAEQDLVITSYAILRRDIDDLSRVEWNYAILDEAQAIKNAATLTARAANRLKARRRLALTGTLLENHLGELWSHFNFLMPGLLGSQRHFVKNFERPVLKGDGEAAAQLRGRIRPFILRRMKSEVATDLPPKVENVLWSEFLPEQAELYKKLLAAGRERVVRAVEEKGLGGARACILDVLLRLRQVCCHPRVLPDMLGAGVGSAKFDQFCEFADEVIEEGNRILVYSQFVSVLKILKGWFERRKIPHLYLDGHTRNREEIVSRFQGDSSIPAFLVSLKAGGTGLNLTGADYVLLYDPWWNPAVEIQAADRAHRIGREGTVFFYRMVAKGSVEEKIRLLQERKKAIADDFVRSEQEWGLPRTQDELLELFEY